MKCKHMENVPEWPRPTDPVIRSPARYLWTTAPAHVKHGDTRQVINLWTTAPAHVKHGDTRQVINLLLRRPTLNMETLGK